MADCRKEVIPMRNWLLRKMVGVSASDVTFEVKEDGSVTKVEMKDEYSKVEISKQIYNWKRTGRGKARSAKTELLWKSGLRTESHIPLQSPVNEELIPGDHSTDEDEIGGKMLHSH